MRRSPAPIRAPLVFLLPLLLVACVSASASQDPASTTVILVRHAEKAATPGDDPPLDSLGRLRAHALAETLRDAGVDAILVTQYQRTAITAEPLARALGLRPRVVDTRQGGVTHARAVADAARAERGRTVLVVGHSNTIPAIVAALGGSAHPIGDQDYDDMYIVVLPSSGSARTIHARYGAPARGAVGGSR